MGFYEVRGNTSMRPSANEAEVRGSSPMGSMRAGVAVSPKKARRVVSGMSLSAAPVNMVNPFAATAGQTQTLSNSQ